MKSGTATFAGDCLPSLPMMNTRQPAACLSTAITVPNTSNLMRVATSHRIGRALSRRPVHTPMILASSASGRSSDAGHGLKRPLSGRLRCQRGTVNTAYATTIAAAKATRAIDKHNQTTQKKVSLRLVAAVRTARPYAKGPSAKRRTGTPDSRHPSNNATAATSNNDHITEGSSAINAVWPSRSGDDRMSLNAITS